MEGVNIGEAHREGMEVNGDQGAAEDLGVAGGLVEPEAHIVITNNLSNLVLLPAMFLIYLRSLRWVKALIYQNFMNNLHKTVKTLTTLK